MRSSTGGNLHAHSNDVLFAGPGKEGGEKRVELGVGARDRLTHTLRAGGTSLGILPRKYNGHTGSPSHPAYPFQGSAAVTVCVEIDTVR
jgi:hypothetical protein